MFLPEIDRASSAPLGRQLYFELRKAILKGALAPATRLPSSRKMAEQLSISRNVVLEAYDHLIAEGFLHTRTGSGTYVSEGAFFTESTSIPVPQAAAINMGYDGPAHLINFRAGTPQLRFFPSRQWLKTVKEVLQLPAEKIFNYGQPEGHHELRQAICEYVVNQREVRCHPDQIIITGGTTQAIVICCKLLLGERSEVILEDPITKDIQHIIKDHQGKLHPVPVDTNGIRTDKLPVDATPAFIYVTPSHQFPTGGTLPVQRRLQLIRYAMKYDAYIVEDDYDSEFRYDGPPLSSLHGLAPDRVLYIGTFSKTLCPGFRIGYLILPPELINHARVIKWQSDLHNEVISQLTLARFIREGYYFRHISRMRNHYRSLRRTITKELQNTFNSRVEILGSQTGLHLVAHFPGYRFTADFFTRTEQEGVRFYPVDMHSIVPGSHTDKLLIGYGHLEKTEIERGIAILAKVMKNYSRDDAERD